MLNLGENVANVWHQRNAASKKGAAAAATRDAGSKTAADNQAVSKPDTGAENSNSNSNVKANKPPPVAWTGAATTRGELLHSRCSYHEFIQLLRYV